MSVVNSRVPYVVALSVIALILLGVALVSAAPVGGLGVASFASAPAPAGAPDDTAMLAAACVGLPADCAAAPRYGFLTDTLTGFANLQQRPAWEVVFTGMPLPVAAQGTPAPSNPNLTTVNVYLDAQTRALIKVVATSAAVPSVPSGELGKLMRVAGRRLQLEAAGKAPRLSLAQALSYAQTRIPGTALQSNELVAYYGLLTDSLPISPVRSEPYWLIFMGGTDVPLLSGGVPADGSPSPEVKTAGDVFIAIQADTGAYHGAMLKSR